MNTEKITIQIIDDFFHDQISANEVDEVIRKLNDKENLREVEKIMKMHWMEKRRKTSLDEESFEVILNKIHHKINIIEEEKIALRLEANNNNKSVRIYHYIIRIAAVLFLPMLFITSYFLITNYNRVKEPVNLSFNEVFTPLSAKTRFVLPDSTIVWLNSGSTLKYPYIFTGKTREVYLTGEGYFNVAKKSKFPFIVKTERLDVTAYGTSFNLMAYPDDSMVETTLVAGKVKVKKKSTGNTLFLTPSYQAVLDTITGKLNTSKVETRFYTSWKDGKLIFKDEQMEIVAHKLERWFNCTIYIKDDKLRKYRYTGNIEMETLREVLELIKITTPLKYTYKRDTREIWIKPI